MEASLVSVVLCTLTLSMFLILATAFVAYTIHLKKTLESSSKDANTKYKEVADLIQSVKDSHNNLVLSVSSHGRELEDLRHRTSAMGALIKR